MRSLALLAIGAFSQTLGSPLQVLEPFNTGEEVSKVWFEDIDGNKLSGEDLVELPDHDVTTLLDGGRWGRSLASGRISQQLLDSLKENGTLTENNDGLTCIKKLMSVEYTDYTEAMTCVHKTKERCHDTFVTQFQPHQEQVCDEKFEKTCSIYYENVAVNEEVEVCKTYLCPDCTRQGPDECQTVYDTVCETKRKVHEVEDDVVNCETVVEKKCVDVKDGFLTKQECDSWPVEKCSVKKVKVTKTTPDTSCREVARELCAPKGCAEKQCHSCENQVKAAVIAKPVEECDLEPQKVCRHVTKLVPHLVSTTECVDVPQEVCGVSKIHPVTKTRPAIKNWCFKSEDPNLPSCLPGSRCSPITPPPVLCPSDFELNEETNECDPIVSGKTLLEQIVFFGFSSDPSGVVTTTMLIGRDNIKPVHECQFSKTITAGDIDTVNNVRRVHMEGDEDLGSYRKGHQCYQAPLDGELSGEFGSVTVTEGNQVDWEGVKMCLDWDQPVYEWICELSPFQVAPRGMQYSLDCKEDRQNECKPFL